MAMSQEDRLKAALQMIKVTPENYKNLTTEIIMHLYRLIGEAEKISTPPSAYEGLTAEQMKERMIG